MPFEPIETPNIAEAAAGQIRDLIARDVLKPGDQLPGERELAARMKISRTSLRAGLQTLSSEGLLVARHGAGLFVNSDLGRSISDPLSHLLETSSDVVFDYLSFRSMLEGESAAIVAQQGTAEEKAHIAEIHDALTQAQIDGDVTRTIQLDQEFHMAIVEATGNLVSIQIARSLTDLLAVSVQRSHAVAYRGPDGRSHIVEQHQSILDAILAGDVEAARNAQSAHISFFADLIRKAARDDAREITVNKRKAWQS